MNALSDFKPGDRVQLHPACDLWMRGARYGIVERCLKVFVVVRVDKVDRAYRFLPSDLQAVGGA